MKKPAKIALTCGDPAGVGPEIITKWLDHNPTIAHRFLPVGPKSWIEQLPVSGQAIGSPEFLIQPGMPTIAGSEVALEAIEWAANACKAGVVAGVVTGPIHKAWAKDAGFVFPGQTEFFQDRWGGMASMAFAGGKLRVVLATWHIPLQSVSEVLTKNPRLIEQAVHQAGMLCQVEGIDQPRMGVCGLNPHAGEAGNLGSEELEWINPFLKTLQSSWPHLSSCQSADTLFYRMLAGEFDVIIALYHDQGLIPVKTLEFDQAVNITLGLPYLRCSPDHGTAFALAGKGLAKTDSLNSACKWMIKALHHQEITTKREQN